jgi:hypothetical protein
METGPLSTLDANLVRNRPPTAPPHGHLIISAHAGILRRSVLGQLRRLSRQELLAAGSHCVHVASLAPSDGISAVFHPDPLNTQQHIPMQTASLDTPIAHSRSLVVTRHRSGRG